MSNNYAQKENCKLDGLKIFISKPLKIFTYEPILRVFCGHEILA